MYQKLLILTLLVSFLTQTTLVAQSEKKFPSFLKERMNHLLDKSRSAVIQDKHSVAIQTLETLTKLIKDNQTAIVTSFFPEFHKGFRSKKQKIEIDSYDNQTSYGVIFSRTYTNTHQHSLILNVVHLDPSIEEYWSLMNSPKLIRNLENTSVIKLNNEIKALKKYTPDRHYVEYTILPSDQLLISIVGNGINDIAILESLINEIDFQGLINYLAN